MKNLQFAGLNSLYLRVAREVGPIRSYKLFADLDLVAAIDCHFK